MDKTEFLYFWVGWFSPIENASMQPNFNCYLSGETVDEPILGTFCADIVIPKSSDTKDYEQEVWSKISEFYTIIEKRFCDEKDGPRKASECSRFPI